MIDEKALIYRWLITGTIGIVFAVFFLAAWAVNSIPMPAQEVAARWVDMPAAEYIGMWKEGNGMSKEEFAYWSDLTAREEMRTGKQIMVRALSADEFRRKTYENLMALGKRLETRPLTAR